MAAPSTGNRIGQSELLAPNRRGAGWAKCGGRATRGSNAFSRSRSLTRSSPKGLSEKHAIAALDHPNIAAIHDAGENYIVMESVDGEPVGAPDSARKATAR